MRSGAHVRPKRLNPLGIQAQPPLGEVLLDARDPMHRAMAAHHLLVVQVQLEASAAVLLGKPAGVVGSAEYVGCSVEFRAEEHKSNACPDRERLLFPAK